MNLRNPTWWLVLVLAATTSSLYFHRLNSVPPYLSVEERSQARQSVILAADGRNEVGDSYPVYFPEDRLHPGREPGWVYAGAALLKALPFSPAVVRWPSATAGVLDVVFMFLVARELFGSTAMGLCAAILLALTPGHFIHSRIATSQITTVTTTLAWLLFLLRYVNRNRRGDLFVATFSLGLGVYFYIVAAVSAPAFFILTVLVVWRREQGSFFSPAVMTACAGMAVAVLPLVVWQALHMNRIAVIFAYYNHDRVNELGWPSVIARLDTWWTAYNPDRLFFSGDPDYRYSTRTAGYFLLPMAFLMLARLWSIRRAMRHRNDAWFIVIGGFILAPLPAVAAASVDFQHWLTLLPFAILAGTAGGQWLIAGGRNAARSGSLALLPMLRWVTPWPPTILLVVSSVGLWVLAGRRRSAGMLCAIGLALVGGIESWAFFDYYFGRYGSDTAANFGGNLPGAIREVLAVSGPQDCIRIDRSIYDVEAQWVLYSRAYHRDELTNRVDGLGATGGVGWWPSCRGATVLTFATDTRFAGWQTIPIPELQGPPRVTVYHRNPE